MKLSTRAHKTDLLTLERQDIDSLLSGSELKVFGLRIVLGEDCYEGRIEKALSSWDRMVCGRYKPSTIVVPLDVYDEILNDAQQKCMGPNIISSVDGYKDMDLHSYTGKRILIA